MTVLQSGMVMTGTRRLPKAKPASGGLRMQLDALRVSLFLLTVISVSAIHQHFPILAALRPAMALTVVALCYAWLRPRLLSGDRWFRTWPARVVIAMAILACFSALFGISMGRAGKFILENYSKELIFAFLVMATIRGPKELYFYMWGYIAGTAALVWMCLFVFGIEKPSGEGLVRLAGSYKYDSNDICVILLVGLGLCLLMLQAAGKFGKLVSLVLLIGIGVVIAKTGSRGGFLGLLCLGAAMLFCLHQVAVYKRVLVVIVTGLALAQAAPAGYWKQMSTIASPKKDYNWSSEGGRKHLWMRGMGYMLEYPVFGIGVDNFPRAEITISPMAKNWRPWMPGIKMSAPHNSYVQMASEMGIPGGLLWISLVVGGFISMVRLSRKLPRSWLKGSPEERFLYLATMYLPVSIAGFAVSSFFVSFAYITPVYLLAAYMVGVQICTDRLLAQNRAMAAQRAPMPAEPRVMTAPLPAPGPALPRPIIIQPD